MPHLCLQPRRRPGQLHIALIGPLDRQTAQGFAEQVSTLMYDSAPAPPTELALDLRCCTAIDTAGANALRGLREEVERHDVVLRIENVPPFIDDAMCRVVASPARSTET
jgi:anti-anti-sigma regulatory factor